MSENAEEPEVGLQAVGTYAGALVLVAALAIVATGWLEILVGLEVSTAVSVPVAVLAWLLWDRRQRRRRRALLGAPTLIRQTTPDEATDATVSDPRMTRSPGARMLAGALWCALVLVAVRGAAGMIIGMAANDPSVPTDELVEVAHEASVAFFAQYGVVVNVTGVAIGVWLSAIGLLPGTAKYKRKPGRARQPDVADGRSPS